MVTLRKVPKGKKLMQRLGVQIDALLMLGLLEISRLYIDSGKEVSPRQISKILNLPLEAVFDVFNELNKLGLVNLYHVPAGEITLARPSQAAFLILRDFALSFKKIPCITESVYRQSKARLGKKVDLTLFENFPDSVKESKWKRVKFHFEDLGLTIYIYENGMVDFKGRNTSLIHEKVALFRLMSYIGNSSEGIEIEPYLWTFTFDLSKFVPSINLEELDDYRFTPNMEKVTTFFDPEVISNVVVRIVFDFPVESCTIIVWATGKFRIIARKLSAINRGVDFMLEYLKQNESWYFM